MNTRAQKTRQHILEVVTNLFYKKGIRAIGVDTVVAEAGIAKMTLYQHFKTKDDLILAFLEHWKSLWREKLIAQIEQSKTPEEKLLAIFDVTSQECHEFPAFRGCALMNTAIELADTDHPAHKAAMQSRTELRKVLTQLANAANIQNPENLANQLLIIYEGAILSAWLQKRPAALQEAKEMASLCIIQAERNPV